jgi:hypothetical protein
MRGHQPFTSRARRPATPRCSASCRSPRARAGQNGWRFQRIGEGEVATLDSVTLKMLEDVQGTKELTDVRGIVVYPDAMCEPLYLVFGSKRRTRKLRQDAVRRRRRATSR